MSELQLGMQVMKLNPRKFLQILRDFSLICAATFEYCSAGNKE
jgi:hypothetical protein